MFFNWSKVLVSVFLIFGAAREPAYISSLDIGKYFWSAAEEVLSNPVDYCSKFTSMSIKIASLFPTKNVNLFASASLVSAYYDSSAYNYLPNPADMTNEGNVQRVMSVLDGNIKQWSFIEAQLLEPNVNLGMVSSRQRK